MLAQIVKSDFNLTVYLLGKFDFARKYLFLTVNNTLNRRISVRTFQRCFQKTLSSYLHRVRIEFFLQSQSSPPVHKQNWPPTLYIGTWYWGCNTQVWGSKALCLSNKLTIWKRFVAVVNASKPTNICTTTRVHVEFCLFGFFCEQILTNDDYIELRRQFKQRLIREFSIENYLFFYDTREFHQRYSLDVNNADQYGPTDNRSTQNVPIEADALRIFRTYLTTDAPDEVWSVFTARSYWSYCSTVRKSKL